MKDHLSLTELEAKLEDACSIEEFKHWQVIYLRTKNPEMSVKDVASICMVSYKAVTQWSRLHNTGVPDALILFGRGGCHRFLLSSDAESSLRFSRGQRTLKKTSRIMRNELP